MVTGICVDICVITWEFIHVILNWVTLYPGGMGRGEAYLGKIKVKDSVVGRIYAEFVSNCTLLG